MRSEAELVDLKERLAVCGVFDHDEVQWLLDLVNEAASMPELVSPDAGEPGRIDGQRTIALAQQILLPIRRHYHRHAMARDRVLEVLNALAFAVEAVLSAIDHDEKAVAFFEQARRQNRMAS